MESVRILAFRKTRHMHSRSEHVPTAPVHCFQRHWLSQELSRPGSGASPPTGPRGHRTLVSSRQTSWLGGYAFADNAKQRRWGFGG